jgi:hypothetical protein
VGFLFLGEREKDNADAQGTQRSAEKKGGVGDEDFLLSMVV